MPKKVKEVLPPSLPPRESLGLSPAVLAKRTTYKPEQWGPNLDRVMVHYDPWCDPYKPRTIHYKDVVKAYKVIKKHIPITPLTKANGSSQFGMNLYFKRETVHRTGSFHERGALYALHMLKQKQRENGVFTASVGNFGMALSYHCHKMNIPVTTYVPTAIKANLIRYGIQYCETVRAGSNLDETRRIAITKMQEKGVTDCYISGFDHPHVIAGAGTIALEILEQLPDVDAILVPIGGGGLIAGIAAVIKKLKPSTLIYGMEPYKNCCFYKALRNGKPYFIKNEMIMPIAGYNAFHTAHALIDKVILVNDDNLAQALLYYAEEERFIVERRSGTAMAILFAEPKVAPELRDKNVVCLVTGGSIDYNVFPRALERAKSVEGRLISMRIAVPVDRTDQWKKVLRVIASLRCSIVHFDMEHTWFETEDMGKSYMVLQCDARGLEHATTVKRVMLKMFPGSVNLSSYASFEESTCPCYPKMWPSL